MARSTLPRELARRRYPAVHPARVTIAHPPQTYRRPMPRWVAVGVLAAAAMALPCRAMAADCATPGVPGQYDVFVGANLTANTGGATIQGRVAAGGDVRVQGIS